MVANAFLSFLEISISASLIIVLLMLLTPFLNKRYATKWKCWIWIFIALRLITPYSGTDGESVVDVLSRVKTQSAMKADKNHTYNSPEQAAAPRRVIIAVPEQMTAPIAMQSEKMSSGITILDIVAYIWMSGSLVFLFIHLSSYLRYKGQVAKKGKVVKDSGILSQIFELKHELHIKSTVRVIKYPEAVSPMMIGFLNPVLVLPEEQYSSEELYFIVKHELVHLKRKDLYVKLLIVMANAVHWFNPLIWVMQKEAAVDMELSCDERVTQGADYEMRKAYTETLLSAFHKQCAKKNYLSTQFYGGKQIMKKRFKNIFRKTRKKNGAVIFLFAAVLTVSLGTVVGCSVLGESAEDISEQTENSSQSEGTDSGILAEFQPEEEWSAEEPSMANASGGEATAEGTTILTFMKEGEPEEKQATLVVGNGYSLYLPDGEWQKEDEDMWRATVNADVRLLLLSDGSGRGLGKRIAGNRRYLCCNRVGECNLWLYIWV